MIDNITIRKYNDKNRTAIRKISCDTAFMGKPGTVFFCGDEVLADVLTLYFTDHEPDSSFVAVKEERVIGYLIGAKNAAIIRKIYIFKIFPKLFLKSIYKGIFLKRKNILFFLACVKSFFHGEFFIPDFLKKYPAVLHINIDNDFRGVNIGKRLIERYLSFLKENSIAGVQCATVSDRAREFFIKHGFHVLFKRKRTYWKRYISRDLTFYVLGKRTEKGTAPFFS